MKKLLIGCGIVALVLLVLSVGGGVVSYYWFRSQMPDMAQVKDARRELGERFGPRDEYAPDLDGRLLPERIELFLAVRESLLASRGGIGARIQSFIESASARPREGRGVVAKIRDGFGLARGGFGLIRLGTEYVGERARKLLDAGMGDGEYTWLYCLMCFSWLEWDPRQALGDAWFDGNDMEQAPEELHDEYRRIFTRQLRNQRRALEDKAPRTADEDQALARVQEALGSARAERFPFQGALPPEWRDVLEPYRARFTATLPRTPGEYLLESVDHLMEEEEGGGFRFQIDRSKRREPAEAPESQ